MFAAAWSSRADIESAPTGVCYNAEGVASRSAAVFPVFRRAGVHARRTTAISKPVRSYRRKVRRDEGIPPYGRLGGCGRPGLV